MLIEKGNLEILANDIAYQQAVNSLQLGATHVVHPHLSNLSKAGSLLLTTSQRKILTLIGLGSLQMSTVVTSLMPPNLRNEYANLTMNISSGFHLQRAPSGRFVGQKCERKTFNSLILRR